MPSLQWPTSFVLVFAASAGAEPPGLPADALNRVRAATVRVTATDGGQARSGSGLFVQADGGVGWVVTDRSVLDPQTPARPDLPKTLKVDLAFRAGTPGEWAAPAEVVAADADYGTVFLRVRADKPFPEPLPAGPDRPADKAPVFVCGHSAGDRPGAVVRPSVVGIRPAGPLGVTWTPLWGGLEPGLPGGPVVAADGRLVGVATTSPGDLRSAYVVPHPAVADAFRGRVGRPALVQSPAQIVVRLGRVEARVCDPLGRVKGVRVLVAPAAPSRGGRDVPPADLRSVPGGRAVDLKPAANDPATVRANLPVPGKGGEVWLQAEWTDADGKTHRGPARRADVAVPEADDGRPVPLVRDPGLRGVFGPDRRPLPPLATRLPPTDGLTTLGKISGDAGGLVGQAITVDAVVTGVHEETPAGVQLFVVDANGSRSDDLDFYTDRATADFLRKLPLAGADDGLGVAARVRGTVRAAADGRTYHLIADEIGLLDVRLQVVATLRRKPVAAGPAAVTLESLRADPAAAVGKTLTADVILRGLTTAYRMVFADPDGLRQLVLQDPKQSPLYGLGVYVSPAFGADIQKEWDRRRKPFLPARVTLTVVRRHERTGDLLAAATDVTLLTDDRRGVAWAGKPAAPFDPAAALRPPAIDPMLVGHIRMLAGLSRQGKGYVGTRSETGVRMTGVADDPGVGPGGRPLKRIEFLDVTGKPVTGVKFYLSETLAGQLADGYRANGNPPIAYLDYRVLRYDDATKTTLCCVGTVRLFDEKFNRMLWSGTGDVSDAALPAVGPAAPEIAPAPSAVEPEPPPAAPPPAVRLEPVPPPTEPDPPPAAPAPRPDRLVVVAAGVTLAFAAVGGLVAWVVVRIRRQEPARATRRRGEDYEGGDDDRPRRVKGRPTPRRR